MAAQNAGPYHARLGLIAYMQISRSTAHVAFLIFAPVLDGAAIAGYTDTVR